jgi:hypothetical protein
MTAGDDVTVEQVSCPECAGVASVEWGTRMSGILHLKVRCVDRHWFFLPADQVIAFGSRHDPFQSPTLSAPPES